MINAKAVLEQFYEAVVQRDMAKARTYLADDMLFVGLFETYPNADAYINTFTQLMSIVTRLDILTIIGEGDQSAVFMTMVTTAPAAATTLVAEWHQVKDGKIIRAQSAFDGRPFAAMFSDSGNKAQSETYDIVHRIGIEAPAPKVYAALSTLDGLAGWWTQQVSGKPEVGGVLQFRFDNQGGSDMQVVELSPSRRVVWDCVAGAPEWIGTRLSFELMETDGETVVLFAQRGWREQVQFMHACSTKWGSFLMSLKALIETGKGAAYPNDPRISRWF
jgi:uncharacterized protein YndB with AHSA1/START domain